MMVININKNIDIINFNIFSIAHLLYIKKIKYLIKHIKNYPKLILNNL